MSSKTESKKSQQQQEEEAAAAAAKAFKKEGLLGYLEVRLISLEHIPLPIKQIAWYDVVMGINIGIGKAKHRTAGRVYIQNKETTADFDCNIRIGVRLRDIEDIDDARVVLTLYCKPKAGSEQERASEGKESKEGANPHRHLRAARVLPFMHIRSQMNGTRIKRNMVSHETNADGKSEDGMNAYGDSDDDDDLLFGHRKPGPSPPLLRMSLSWFPKHDPEIMRPLLNAHLYKYEYERYLLREKQWQTGWVEGKPRSLVEAYPPKFKDERKRAILDHVAKNPRRFTGNLKFIRWKNIRLPMRCGHVLRAGFMPSANVFKFPKRGTVITVTDDMMQYATINNDGGRGYPQPKEIPRVKQSPLAITSAILRALFVQVDANNDGDLTKAEWLTAVTKNSRVRDLLDNPGIPKSLRQLLNPKRYRGALLLMDTNKDGVISLDELLDFGLKLAKQQVIMAREEARNRAEARSKKPQTPGTGVADQIGTLSPEEEAAIEKERIERQQREAEDNSDEDEEDDDGFENVEPAVFKWLHDTNPQFTRYAEVFLTYGVASYKRILLLTEEEIAQMGVKKRDIAPLFGGVRRLASEVLPYHYYINFSKRNLFSDGASSKLDQDELQVLEHPILLSMRNALLHLRQEAIDHEEGQGVWGANSDPLLSPICKTPCSIIGVERHVHFDISASGLHDPNGLWGNGFGRAGVQSIVRNCKRMDNPTPSHILTMVPLVKNPTQLLWHRLKAPDGDDRRGRYTMEQIREMLSIMYTSFRSARLSAEKRNYGGNGVQLERDNLIVIHTSHWGCSELDGGNIKLTAICQIIAATTAGIDELCYHGVTPAQMDVVNEALKFATFITAPKPPRELDEMEAKVAAINGIDQELMNELREGGISTVKIIKLIYDLGLEWQHPSTNTQWSAFGAGRR